MHTVIVMRVIDERTWAAEVRFEAWHQGPQYDEAPADVTCDGEPIIGVKWARSQGWKSGWTREDALVEAGCLWAPGIVGHVDDVEQALAVLSTAVRRAVAAHGREREAKVA